MRKVGGPCHADSWRHHPDRRRRGLLDHTWNETFSSAVGYSWQDNDNTEGQAADAFKTGQYALGTGVGGGIVAVSPGKFGIAVIAPPLDDAGNSIKAQRAIADISNVLGGNPYVARPKN